MLNPRRLLLVAASSLVLTGLLGQPALAHTQIAASTAQAPASKGVWAHQNSNLAVDDNVRFGVLPNGMRYALMKNATPPGQAALRLRIDAGSLMESDQQLGLAHFMEHMTFNGTTNIPKNELLRILERLGLAFGADTNAATSFDQTYYQLQLPRTNDETVDTALRIMREQVSEALMEAEAIDEERGVVEGEQRRSNTPGYRSTVAQLNLLAPDQLISKRLPIGDLSIIRTAPRERFVEFYNAYYRPERATMIAVGDFDVDQMEAKIKAQFSSWQGKGANGPNPDLGKVQPREPETRILIEPGTQSGVQLIWIREPDLRPDSLEARQRMARISVGLGALNLRLGEMARADNPPFLGAGASTGSLANSLDTGTIAAGFNPGGLDRALETIEQELRRLLEHGVSQAEIDRQITNTRSALETAAKASSTRNTSALANALLGSINNDTVFTSPETQLALFEQTVPSLTVEAVNQAVKEAFVGSGPLALVTSPVPIEGGEEAVTQTLLASQKIPVAANEAQANLDWPYTDFGTVGSVVSTTPFAPMDATIVTFANNVRLIVKHTDFKKEEVLVTVRTGTGALGLPTDRFSPVSLSTAVFQTGGLGKLTADEINRVLTGRIYGVGFTLDSEVYQLSGATRPEDLDLQMQVLGAYLTDPGLRPAPLEMIKGMYPQIIAQTMATPAGAFSMLAPTYLANGDRREAMPSLEDVASVTNDAMKQGLLAGMATGPIEIIMVGDVTVEAATQAVAKTFGAMAPRPARAAPLPGSDQRVFPGPTAQPLVLTHTGQADQGLAYIAWPTTDQVKDRTTARQLAVLAAILQLRANEEIREKRAIAYAPGVGSSASSLFKGYGSLSISAETKPDNFDDFYQAVDAIISDIKTTAPSEDELNRARAPMVESYRRALAGNGAWLGLLEGHAFGEADVEQDLGYLKVIEAVTPEQLQTLAQTYLKPETAWKAVVQKGD